MARDPGLHRLVEVDPEARTATCTNCGTVDIIQQSKGGGRRSWRCGIKVRADGARKRDTEAQQQYQKEYRRKNRDKATAALKKWLEEHPGKEQEYNNRSNMMKRHGMTPEQYMELLEAQGGKCACCGRDNNNGRRLAIDHDHKTGVIRGLLCHSCNVGIGHLGDTVEGLLRAVAYLQRPQSHPRCLS